MLNMLDTQDKLKNFSEQQLIKEMQMPTGSAPQFMVLSEIERRKRMRADVQRQEGLMQPTVAQEAVSAAGVPQQGIAQIAQSMAPQTDMTQNTGALPMQGGGLPGQPQRMASGGVVKLAPGGDLSALAQQSSALATDPEIIRAASQSSMTVDEYISMLPPKIRAERLNMLTIDQSLGRLRPVGTDANGYPRYEFVAPFNPEGAAVADREELRQAEESRLRGEAPDETPVSQSTLDRARDYYSSDTSTPIEEIYNFGANSPLAGISDEEFDSLSARSYAARQAMEMEAAREAQARDDRQQVIDRARQGTRPRTFGDPLEIPAEGVEALLPPLPPSKRLDDSVLPTLDPGAAAIAGMQRGFDSLVSRVNPPATEPDYADRFGIPQSSFAGQESTQARITRLRGIIDNPDADVVARAGAAQELESLQERIAITQFGGNIPATAEGRGLEVPPGYMLTALGIQPDPNYMPPGKSGVALLDQAAMQGEAAVAALVDAGVVTSEQAKLVAPRVAMTGFEGDILPINRTIQELEAAADNPYVPDDLRNNMLAEIESLQGGKEVLFAGTARQAPEFFQPEPPFLFQPEPPSIAGGYEGLIDTTSPALSVEPNYADRFRPEIPDATPAVDQSPEGVGIETLLPPEASPLATPSGGGGTPSGGGGTPSGGGALDDGAPTAGSSMDQDKWLALAQAGFTLMSTGDFGKAGQAGLAAYSQSKQAAQDARKLEAELAFMAARTRAADRPRGGGTTGLTINQILSRGNDLVKTGQDMINSAEGNADVAAQGQQLIAWGMAMLNMGDSTPTNTDPIQTPSASQTGG